MILSHINVQPRLSLPSSLSLINFKNRDLAIVWPTGFRREPTVVLTPLPLTGAFLSPGLFPRFRCHVCSVSCCFSAAWQWVFFSPPPAPGPSAQRHACCPGQCPPAGAAVCLRRPLRPRPRYGVCRSLIRGVCEVCCCCYGYLQCPTNSCSGGVQPLHLTAHKPMPDSLHLTRKYAFC